MFLHAFGQLVGLQLSKTRATKTPLVGFTIDLDLVLTQYHIGRMGRGITDTVNMHEDTPVNNPMRRVKTEGNIACAQTQLFPLSGKERKWEAHARSWPRKTPTPGTFAI